MATSTKDRLEALLASTALNGIDFVEVASADQRTLRVHFLNAVAVAGTVSNPQITGGESIPTVQVNPINNATDWSADSEGRPLLTLTTVVAGDFSFYTLSLTSPVLDPFYTDSVFSFKANCPSTLDCEAPAPPCPPPTGNPPPIEYLAKDFLSFRQALMDFSALRYPQWQERSEPDFGMMFLEALSGLADDLSYTQDRVATEASLATATQRRSIVRQARLVDYEPRTATSATVQLQFNVTTGPIPAGVQVSAFSPDGLTIVFEVGTGLADSTQYAASPNWNRPIQPYYWDQSQVCLNAGATEMWVLGHGFSFTAGQALLIDTQAVNTADPPVREIIHITSANEEADPLFLDSSSNPTPVTHVVWGADEALQYAHDLTRTVVAGNIVPATQGQRLTESFAIDTPPAGNVAMPLAVVRTGPNSTAASLIPIYEYTLSRSPLVWLAPDSETEPLPEIALTGTPPNDAASPWPWLRSLLDAETFENAFTLDRARFVPIAKNSDGTISYDYDGDNGDTLRFGDDVFGTIPPSGTIFQVTYRVGSGAAGNLAADTITGFSAAAAPFVVSVTNPYAASGGADEEPNETVQRLAPQAFRAVQYNAVRPADYEAAAETLDWVDRAGTVYRWTGSWLSVFTTADPKGGGSISTAEDLQLFQLLDRRRLAGYESYILSPQYVSLDIEIGVCANVEAAVLAALSAVHNPDGSTGFFYPDNFTFGQPLERSALEAAVQDANGVAGVHYVHYRQRGVIVNYVHMPAEVKVGAAQVIRVDNDPSRPENGSLKIVVDGGK
jgi:Baseplate J-like protein